MATITHTNPRCKGRTSMNGHCLVCDAARANGTSDESLRDIAAANAPRDAAGETIRRARTTQKSVPEIPDYIPENQRDRVAHWDDERSLGNSLIVSLKPGWQWPDEEGVHVRGFDTVKEARVALRQTTPCNCPQCEGKGSCQHR